MQLRLKTTTTTIEEWLEPAEPTPPATLADVVEGCDDDDTADCGPDDELGAESETEHEEEPRSSRSRSQ